MRRAVFQHFHSSSHPGIKSETKSIGRLMVWRDMRKDIKQWTKECQACARSKVIRRNTINVEVVTPPPRGRFTHVYLNIISPLGLSKCHNYALTVIDRFSRFFQAIPLVGITAEECVDGFIRHWVSLFGCPERIYCDRGCQFTSTVWNDMCVTLGCELHHSTAYHPQAQGLIERFNKTLKTSLKCHEEPSEWYDQLPWTHLALRNMPKEDLDFSIPNNLLFGQPVRLSGKFFEDAFNINSSSFAQSLSTCMQQIPYFAPRRTNKAHYVDKALMAPSTTHVFIKIDSHRPPLYAVYKGPFRIIQRHPKYFVVDLRIYIDNISVDRLKVAHLSLEGLNHNIKSQQPRLVNSSLSASELGAGNSNIIPTKPSLPTSTITCSPEDNMPTDTIHLSSLTSPQVIT